MSKPQRWMIGNWKMNVPADIEGYARRLSGLPHGQVQVALCPPATTLERLSEALRSTIVLTGGQDCHPAEHGAFTGSVSVSMLQSAGARLCLAGHSERRQGMGESDQAVAAKIEAIQRQDMIAVACVGEPLAIRLAGEAGAFTIGQLLASLPPAARADRLIVAYEPVWAIGTGRTPLGEEIEAMHAALREALTDRFGESGSSVAILYGGSVTPSNVGEIIRRPDVSGCLVGGASLDPATFITLINSAAAGRP